MDVVVGLAYSANFVAFCKSNFLDIPPLIFSNNTKMGDEIEVETPKAENGEY
jgi:hypothetical protein